MQNLEGYGRGFAQLGVAEPANFDGDLRGFIHEQVGHRSPIRLNPARSRARSVADRDGVDQEIVLASTAPVGALCRHHKGEAVQQKQANKKERSSVGHGSHG